MYAFEGYDFTAFWDEAHQDPYHCGELKSEAISQAEQSIGYRLPQSYIELLKTQNGGIPILNTYPLEHAEIDGIELSYILGIGNQDTSLTGRYGQSYAIDEMGYPNVGIYFADTTMEGMLLLMYMHPDDVEPSVCFVSQQEDFTIYPLEMRLPDFISSLIQLQPQDDETLSSDMDNQFL